MDNRPPQILILGSGEIARALAELAQVLTYPVWLVEPGASDKLGQEEWAQGITTRDFIFADAPFALNPHTHAVIARGHEGDEASLTALVEQGAAWVYLIASARRAETVLHRVREQGVSEAQMARVSAPAGLELGGRDSAQIALSILAEIQMRHFDKSGRPLESLRDEKLRQAANITDDGECPGRRP